MSDIVERLRRLPYRVKDDGAWELDPDIAEAADEIESADLIIRNLKAEIERLREQVKELERENSELRDELDDPSEPLLPDCRDIP